MPSVELEPRLFGPYAANFVVLSAYFGNVNFDDFDRKERNASRYAHLDYLGFPKMYEP